MNYLVRFFCCVIISGSLHAQEPQLSLSPADLNAAWVQAHLFPSHPRLVLTPRRLQAVRQASSPLMRQHLAYLKRQADELLEVEPLERKQVGRRLLGVSREALRRLGALSMVYLVEQDDRYRRRVEAELRAVCTFSDWNPSHFLDVAEMSTAVALALDWLHGELSEEVERLARRALLTKGLAPSFEDANFNWWIVADNNWNQVCHAGMLAAALVLAEEDPQLAADVIRRLLTHTPTALEAYAPDGAYPEGPGYWSYGTAYSLLMFDMLNTALETDFGLPQLPGFMGSATYRLMMATPSGQLYNYADNNGQGLGLGTLELLSWFARETRQAHLLPRDAFARALKQSGRGSRFSSMAHVWLADCMELAPAPTASLPAYWQGQGDNPVAVLKGQATDPYGYYLGLKGGRGSVNHGNMDAGAFVFEWKGVMWSVDMGNQSYNELEQVMGGDLWDRSQESPRWSLLTKNNFGHSTLTVNDALHRVDGFASVSPVAVKEGQLRVSVELSEVFEGQLEQAVRTFVQPNDHSLLIRDEFRLHEATELLSWNMMTQAAVELKPGGAVLRQAGASLSLKVLAPEEAQVSVVSLTPTPLPIDKHIPQLKRLEIRLPAYLFPEGTGRIEVLLEGI